MSKRCAPNSDCLLTLRRYHGIATHYIHSSSLPDLEARLAELTIPDYASLPDRLKIINTTIAEYVSSLPHDQPIQLSGNLRKAIDRCFQSDSLGDIMDALRNEPSRQNGEAEWAQKTLAAIEDRSPTSLMVTLRQLSLGRNFSISETFKREHEVAAHFMDHPDFVEGVSARLIHKTKGRPNWQPSKYEDVNNADVDQFLRPYEGMEKPIQLLNTRPQDDYKNYPHAWIGLPSENMVRQIVKVADLTREQLVKSLEEQAEFKVGVREVVEEILERRTRVDPGYGNLRWVD